MAYKRWKGVAVQYNDEEEEALFSRKLPIKINWSAYGDCDIATAEKFLKDFQEAKGLS